MCEDLPEGNGGQGVSAGEGSAPDSPMLWLRILLPPLRMFKSGELQARVEIQKWTKGCSLPCRPTGLTQNISMWWKTGWPHVNCLLEMLPCHLGVGNAKCRAKGLGVFWGLSGSRRRPHWEMAAEHHSTDQISASFTPTSAFIWEEKDLSPVRLGDWFYKNENISLFTFSGKWAFFTIMIWAA